MTTFVNFGYTMKIKTFQLLLAFISIFFVFNVNADISKEDYFLSIEKKANTGDVDAQFEIGSFYYQGFGVTQSYENSAKWFLKAAKAGNLKAQHNLGNAYRVGKGVVLNKKKAFFWFNKAANQNSGLSQLNLAIIYETGQGAKQDYDKALYWYEKAEKNGIDIENGIEDLKKKKNRIEAKIRSCFSELCKLRTTNPLSKKLKEDVKRIIKNVLPRKKEMDSFFLKSYISAIMDGFIDDRVSLGSEYFNGTMIEKNRELAVLWFRGAAEEGHPVGQYELALCYQFGKGLIKNRIEANKWFKKAFRYRIKEANTGDSKSQFILAGMYNHGWGVDKNDKKCFYWNLQAAKGGYAKSYFNVGASYQRGKGIEKNSREALKWYLLAKETLEEEERYEALVSTLSNIGELYSDSKKYKKALLFFEESLALNERIRKDNIYNDIILERLEMNEAILKNQIKKMYRSIK